MLNKTKSTLGLWIFIFSYAILSNVFLYVNENNHSSVILGGNIFAVIAPLVSSIILFFASKNTSSHNRTFWALLSIGSFLFFVADFIWGYYEVVLKREVPFPGLPDLFYLLFIVVYFLAFTQRLFLQRENLKLMRFVFDILIIMTVAFIFSWNFLLKSIVNDQDASFLSVFVSVSYPIGDLILLFGATGLYISSKHVFPKFVHFLLALGLSILIIADSVYMYRSVTGTYESNQYLDTLWPIALLIIAMASVYDRNLETKKALDKNDSLGWGRILLPYLSVFPLFIFLLIEHKRDIDSFFIGFCITTFLIIVRQIVALFDNQRLLNRLQTLTNELESKVRERTKLLLKKNDELQESFEKVQFLAYHDTLTGLPNRRLFKEKLDEAIIHSKQNKRPFSLFMIDLDRFKHINDNYGHGFGDMFIKEVSHRIKGCLKPEDVCSRQGGDEFSIIITRCKNLDDVKAIVHSLNECLSVPIDIEGRELHVTASIGVAIYPTHGDDAETLLQASDMAMYQAKQKGKNTYEFFDSNISEKFAKKLDIENGLRKAIERNEFLLYYQPQFDLKSEKIIGAEALIRWNRTGKGLISPGEFIPVAEETGLIIPMSEWIVHTVCKQTREWMNKGIPPLKLSINLSAKHFEHKELIPLIVRALNENQIEAKYLDLEITESIAMGNIDQAIQILSSLKELGVHISMDDFGTGFSSLNYLKKLPIDTLKIDQSFVRDIELDHEDEQIIAAILALSQSLNLNVIAEGVENQHQITFLKKHGCREAQGYYYSKPLPAEEFERFITQYVEQALF